MNENNRQYLFTVNNEKFVFDGNNVSVLVGDTATFSKKEPTINSDRMYRSKFLNNIILTITNNCNLCCDYCFANKGLYDAPHERMSYETAKKSIDITLESVIKNKGCFFVVNLY